MANGLRIAIVCSYYPWPPRGGVETIVNQVSVELANRGHDVHVVTTPFNAVTMKQVSKYGIERKDGVTIHKLKPSELGIGYAKFMKELKPEIQKIKPEIIHSHNLHPHLFQLARWKQEMGYKLLAELHFPIINIEFLSAKLALPIVVKYLAKSSRDIDAFVAHESMESKWLTGKGISAGKVYKVWFPCISRHLLNYVKTSNIQKNDDLLFIGRVVRMKGLHVLVKALKYVSYSIKKDVKLTIVGPQNEIYAKYLERLISKLNLNDQVNMKGVVSEDEKYRLIASHKIFVLPSLGDYTPSVILEAQALGTPVIATRVGAIPTMLINGKTGLLVKPGDAMELAEGIKKLYVNDDLRESMSKNAKEFSKNFLLERSIKKLEHLYYRLAYLV
jgi:glycosyltransferase involved in cell wall biosynthesis